MIHGNAGDGDPAGIMYDRLGFDPIDKSPELQLSLVRYILF